MPRIAWSSLVILVLALPLASCFDDEGTCPTCPPEKSSRIDFIARPVQLQSNNRDTLKLDSVHVSVDGGSRVTARPGQRLTFEGLSRGAHDVKIVRWFTHNDISESRSSSLQIELTQGETRVIDFHDDFARVAWWPVPGIDRGGTGGVAGLALRGLG
jgi:hypothetical protein